MRAAVLTLSLLGPLGGCDAKLSRPGPDMEPAAHDGTGRLDQRAVDALAGDGPADGARPDGPPLLTGQCAVSAPPAAQAAGLTKLAFCDDFSDPSTFDFKGTGNPGFKWYRNYWFSFSQTTKPEAGEPESSFTMKDGVLELKTQSNHYQSNFQSAILKNGQPVGYCIDRETGGWYVEAGLAHPASADGVLKVDFVRVWVTP